LKFLEELCNISGPSGFEKESILLTKKYVKSYVDSVDNDKLGNMFFEKVGKKDGPVILLPAHIDEIGFLITSINTQGYLTFTQLGGWFDQVLLGQRVLVITKKGVIRGIIASKPPHVMDQEERKKVITKEKMFIDVGAANKEEAEAMGVRIGDAAVPDSAFYTLTKKTFKDGKPDGKRTIAFAKAFDNRICVFIGTEILRILKEEKVAHPNRVIFATTVQEEVGLRGARTAANFVKPDVAIILDVGIAGDVPGIEPQQAIAKMGGGVLIDAFDASMIPNQPLKELAITICEKNKIPYQLATTTGGGTDGGQIHLANIGCPSLVLGVAVRHIHSHVGVVDLEDARNCARAIVELIRVVDKKTVDGLTAI